MTEVTQQQYSQSLHDSNANFFGKFRWLIVAVIAGVCAYYYGFVLSGEAATADDQKVKAGIGLLVGATAALILTMESVTRFLLAGVPSAAITGVLTWLVINPVSKMIGKTYQFEGDNHIWLTLLVAVIVLIAAYVLISQYIGKSSFLGKKCRSCGSRGTVEKTLLEKEFIGQISKRVREAIPGTGQGTEPTQFRNVNVPYNQYLNHWEDNCSACNSIGNYTTETESKA